MKKIIKVFMFVWIFIILISFSNGEIYTSGTSCASTQAGTNKGWGWTGLLTGNLTLNEIIKHTSCTAQNCELRDESRNLIVNGSFIGNTCKFAVPQVLNQSSIYIMMAFSPDGVVWTDCYNNDKSYPITFSRMTLQNETYATPLHSTPSTWTTDSTWFQCVVSINVTNTSVSPGDTTPPSITIDSQIPSNITGTNVFNDVFINSTITDETALNITSPRINLTLGNISIFVSGELYPMNYIYNYTNFSGSLYEFELEESDFLPATYNYNESIMESTQHENATLTGLNSFLKIQFRNVSNKLRANFYEMYDESIINNTQVDYIYCNDDYISGNPISHNNCTLFQSRTSNKYNHTHGGGFSSHNVIPMGIDTDTGTINGVLVTPLSYILIRGLVGGHKYFYINLQNENTAETSNSNGNTWTPQTYTVDSHIHSFSGNCSETVNFNIFAYDQSSNKGFSILKQDCIDFPIFPPNAVNIISPVENTYNTTIEIIHSASTSASGQSITGYKYEYKRVDLLSWITIIENNYPSLTYDWDISSILNADYQVRVTTTDSLNLTSLSVSEIFTIENPLTITEQYLQGIFNALTELVEMVGTIGFILLIIAFLFLGAKVNFIFWSFSGLMFWLLAILDSLSGTFSENLALNIIYILFGFALFFGGVFMELGKLNNSTEETKEKDMYEDFYDR